MKTDVGFRVGNIYISNTNPVDTKFKIKECVEKGQNAYICVSNVRSVMEAHHNPRYLKVMSESFMNIPDGTPLVWLGHLWGFKEVKRTMGPDIMIEMLKDKSSNLKHFLLGDTEDTLKAMLDKFNDSNIVGFFSPPFCEVDDFDYPSISKLINDSGADVVWISLRAPKQDIFASLIMPYLSSKVCVGVGAAFRYSLGGIKEVPIAVKKIGLSGMFFREWDVVLLKFYAKAVWNLTKWSIDIIISRLRGENKYNSR